MIHFDAKHQKSKQNRRYNKLKLSQKIESKWKLGEKKAKKAKKQKKVKESEKTKK